MNRIRSVNLSRYPRVWLTTVLAVLACAGWYVQGQQQQRTVRTGKTTVLEAKDVQVIRIRWEPGSRTYWHSHFNPSVIIVEEGRARMQERGNVIIEAEPGQPVYMAPKVEHWHGASSTVGATTVAVYPGGAKLDLGKEVTNEEYLGKR